MDLSRYNSLFVISDIHGNADAVATILKRFRNMDNAHLLIAGDLVIRHSEPAAALLRGARNHITAVQGNCDSSRDQELAGFPLPLTRNLLWGKRTLLLTHGHIFSIGRLPLLPQGSMLITGHSHIPHLYNDEETGITMLNPGSISKPLGGSRAAYGIITHSKATLHALQSGKKFLQLDLPG